MKRPRYPIYIPSKGRADNHTVFNTARFLIEDGVPFFLVVEPFEAEQYIERWGIERVLVLPFENLGLGSIPARNWIWDHARDMMQANRHWVIDDNIQDVRIDYRGARLRYPAGPALWQVEEFTERYVNVAISGLAYKFFVTAGAPAYRVNAHVYSCMLIKTDLDYRWRGRYNEDTDLCLQVLAGGWCTVQVNVFSIEKATTLRMRGGNEQIYQDDGRTYMSRELERRWPHVVSTRRRFGRSQHVINWRQFKRKLILHDDVDISQLPFGNYFNVRLEPQGEIKSQRLRKLLEDNALVKS